ncbi:MAG: hypothetical protein KAG61_14250 [Bacteriovoracaceae bacterium]|nr:hypothetical protein [Bacteriovoracaceae bacterium]
MGVKLHKKGTIINNLSIFSVLSLLFLHIIASMGRGTSAIDWQSLLTLLKSNGPLVTCFFLTFLSIRSASKLSKFLVPIFSTLILWNSFSVFFNGFDKLILVLNLAYLIVAFYFFAFWLVELSEPLYTPGFSIEDVGRKSSFDFKVKIFFGNEMDGWGYITQVGEGSCFIAVEENLRRCRGKAKLVIDYENTIFEQYGEVITSYGGGFGIKFLNDTERDHRVHNWNDFFTVVCHRGLLPQYFEGLT